MKHLIIEKYATKYITWNVGQRHSREERRTLICELMLANYYKFM